ncbi:hypothetical protein MRX96_026312 [Rhipicephalus microplus]
MYCKKEEALPHTQRAPPPPLQGNERNRTRYGSHRSNAASQDGPHRMQPARDYGRGARKGEVELGARGAMHAARARLLFLGSAVERATVQRPLSGSVRCALVNTTGGWPGVHRVPSGRPGPLVVRATGKKEKRARRKSSALVPQST